MSYYDRQYGSDETTGDMDVSVSTSSDLARFKVSRATSSSMPLPTQFPDTQGNSVFFGDYSGLSAQSGAHPLWMDTRNPDLFVCPGTAAPGVPPALCLATSRTGYSPTTRKSTPTGFPPSSPAFAAGRARDPGPARLLTRSS